MFTRIWYRICSSCRKQKSRTIRFAFPLIVFAAVLAGATITSEDHSYVTVETTPSNIRKGEQFFIDITAVANKPVNAVDIVLKYPESQIEVTGIDTGESVITLWTEEPYAADGSVYLRGGTFGQGFLGKHKIARIRADAIESGTAYVSTDLVRFVAGDGQGTEIDVNNSKKSKIYIANTDGSLVGTASVRIITDINGDGEVSLADISAFMSSWFKKDVTFDFNGDGKMTFHDFSILLADSFFN